MLVIKNVCVRACTQHCGEHRLLLFLLGSVFDPTLYSCKHKYLSTKEWIGSCS